LQQGPPSQARSSTEPLGFRSRGASLSLSGTEYQTQVTSAAGTYSFADLLPGVYHLYTSADGYLGEYFDDASDYGDRVPIVVSGTTDFMADVALDPAPTITGTVRAEGCQSPAYASCWSNLAAGSMHRRTPPATVPTN
jgi:hypothetical protein